MKIDFDSKFVNDIDEPFSKSDSFFKRNSQNLIISLELCILPSGIFFSNFEKIFLLLFFSLLIDPLVDRKDPGMTNLDITLYFAKLEAKFLL